MGVARTDSGHLEAQVKNFIDVSNYIMLLTVIFVEYSQAERPSR